jgi:hypothetical protein
VIESTTDSAMVGTATTYGTFTITAAGGNWMTRAPVVNGQNYYRFRVVAMSGAANSFQLAAAIGVKA